MINLSQGLTLTWQIAANEAAYTKHQFIEKEHIFIALCKVCGVLRPEFFRKIEDGLNKDSLKMELEKLDELFAKLNLDSGKLRRRLRKMLAQGIHEHTCNVIHRSEDCKEYFARAFEIADNNNSQNANVFHILNAIMSDPGKDISRAVCDFGVRPEDLKTGAESLGMKINKQGVAGSDNHKEQNKEGKSKTPFLDKYGRDLTDLAKQGRIGPIVERRSETLKIIRTLTNKTKRNPLLIGSPGVGKTAIVEGLALRIADGNLTNLLRNSRVIELNMGSLVAGTKYRGEFEEKIGRIIDEASSNPDIILFIDEIHTLIGAGGAEGIVMDAADIFKPALSRGDITCIGATTIEEYRRYIEKDQALKRRFHPVMIQEPSPEEAIKILDILYGTREDIRIDPLAVRAAVELSVKYVKDRLLPDKAIDIMEEACSRVRVPELTVQTSGNDKKVDQGFVDAEVVAKVISDLTGIPIGRLSEKEKERFINMSHIIKERVIGQDEAVERISQALRMQMAGLKDAKKPIGVFLLLGPTGVGKTELAKALAEFLFGSESAIIRIDMSEFTENNTISKLIGAPPGYIGHDREGQLTGQLRSKPFSVVLLDEIEKAHPEVFDLFLQVFDEGRLTDSEGRTIDARNAIFIMTSNTSIGPSLKRAIGFASPNSVGTDVNNDIRSGLEQTFRREFLNRIDEIVFFHPLGKQVLFLIAINILNELQKKLGRKGMDFYVEDRVLEVLCRIGYDPENGARPLKRVIESLVIKPLSEKLLKDEFMSGDTVSVDAEGEKIVFKKKGGK